MNFLIKADILNVIDIDTLNVITDNNDLNLDEAELRGIEEMIGYLSIRYNTEDIFDATDKNALIKMYLADIMLYHLHASISPDNIPELREKRYNTVKDWLEKVADGFISPTLPIKAVDKNYPLRSGSSLEKQNHYY